MPGSLLTSVHTKMPSRLLRLNKYKSSLIHSFISARSYVGGGNITRNKTHISASPERSLASSDADDEISNYDRGLLVPP